MFKPLLGEKIAVLVANGFCEGDLTETQRALQAAGANLRIVSMDHGLVNSWNEDRWGLHFAADQALSSALAADYSILVVPGGQRSVEKLKLTAHTRRFIRGFMDTSKPVIVFDEALELLAFSESVSGRQVTGPAGLKADMEQAGAVWVESDYAVDDMLMTGGVEAEGRAAYIEQVMAFLTAAEEPVKVAA